MRYPLAAGDHGPDEAAAVDRVLRSGHTSMGREVAALEEEWAEACGVSHAVAVSSCTAALEIAVECCHPAEWSVASMTFVAGPDAIRRSAGWPVWRDIESPWRPVATGCALGIAYAGLDCGPCEVLDAAHCYPTDEVDWQSRVQCWSLHGTKILTCGEGGILTTDDADIADRARLMRRHGIDRGAGRRPADYDVTVRGSNWAMDDIRAAVARVQLRRRGGLLARRAEVMAEYRARLGYVLPSLCMAVVVLPDEHAPRRTALMAHLAAAGIETSVHYPPAHRLTTYDAAGRLATAPSLRVTEDYARRTLTLPLSSLMTAHDAQVVAEEVLRGMVG